MSIDIDALRIFASFNIWGISEIISIDCLFIWEWIVFSFFSCLFWLYPTHCECFLMFELWFLWVLSFLKQLNWLKNSRLCPSCLGSNTSIVYFSLSWSAWSVPHECLVQKSATESGAPSLYLLSGTSSLTLQWLWLLWILFSGSSCNKDCRFFVGILAILSGENWGYSPLPTVFYFLRLKSLMWSCWANGMFMSRLAFSPRAVLPGCLFPFSLLVVNFVSPFKL